MINLEIRKVQIQYKSGSWNYLPVTPRIYDLVKMKNGQVYTVVDNGSVNPGSVKKLRLLLGPNNSVQVDGRSKPLMVESTHMDNGIVFERDFQINRNDWIGYRIGFDVAESVVLETDGTYRLKPIAEVIHVFRRPMNETSKADPIEGTLEAGLVE